MRQLGYFQAVVHAGSFSRAAVELHVTQPSLSVAVRRLEDEFGVKLLIRRADGVEPTEAGAYLLTGAERVLSNMEGLRRALVDWGQGKAGRVVLATEPSYSWEYLPQVLRLLHARYPGLEVVVQDPPPHQVLQLVRDGQADIGVVPAADLDALRRLHGDQLELRTSIALPLVAVVPRDFAGGSQATSLEELKDQTWIVPVRYPTFPGIPEMLERWWAAHPQWRPRVITEVATLQTSLPLVAAGLGVAVMPAAVRSIASEAIAVQEITDGPAPLHATVVWNKDVELTPAVQRTIHAMLTPEQWDPAGTVGPGR